MAVPYMKPVSWYSPHDDDMGISEESALFLRAIGIAADRGFAWWDIHPEDRERWARRVLEWEAEGNDQ